MAERKDGEYYQFSGGGEIAPLAKKKGAAPKRACSGKKRRQATKKPLVERKADERQAKSAVASVSGNGGWAPRQGAVAAVENDDFEFDKRNALEAELSKLNSEINSFSPKKYLDSIRDIDLLLGQTMEMLHSLEDDFNGQRLTVEQYSERFLGLSRRVEHLRMRKQVEDEKRKLAIERFGQVSRRIASIQKELERVGKEKGLERVGKEKGLAIAGEREESRAKETAVKTQGGEEKKTGGGMQGAGPAPKVVGRAQEMVFGAQGKPVPSVNSVGSEAEGEREAGQGKPIGGDSGEGIGFGVLDKKFSLPPNHGGARMLVTDFDRLLGLVQKKGKIGADSAARELGIGKDSVLACASVLESQGLVSVFYPAIGSPIISARSAEKEGGE